MALPAGELWTYRVTVGEPGASLPVSFDQRRHVSQGDRPGSWMGLALRLQGTTTPARLASAWHRVVDRHGTLRTVFQQGADGLELREVPVARGEWVHHDRGDRDVRTVLREVLDELCRPLARPSFVLCRVEHEDSVSLVVASDHAHVDMWSLAVVARDLLAYVESPLGDVLPRTHPFVDHTRELRALPPAPDEVRDEWTRILHAGGDVMPRFPLPLGDVSEPRPAVVLVRDVLDAAETRRATTAARSLGVGLLAVALGAMTAATRERADAPFRAVFPVHSRHDPRWLDAVGWLITNSVLESDDADPVACHAAVKRSLRLGSWPLEDLLEPWGGMPEAPGMFALSWLDVTRLNLHVPLDVQAQYVGATLRTDGVMVWFVTNATGLHLRCRYPDTPEARTHVTGWLDDVTTRIREVAG